MSKFNFITSGPFREALDSDFAEAEQCFKAAAWKAVLVLAGSVVEAVLIDHLVASGYQPESGKDLLKFDLAEAVEACRKAGVLSEKAANLCSAVRGYRNLIHPGRVIRLKESVSPSDAHIALSLIDIVVTEVARARKDEFGLTAEQIVNKVEIDADALPLLSHLLRQTSHSEKERLLLDVLPNRYLSLYYEQYAEEPLPADTASMKRLRLAYRLLWDQVDEDTRGKATMVFVDLLKTADGHRVGVYRDVFFRASDLSYVTESAQAMVRDHLLASVLRGPLEAEDLEIIRGIEYYLRPKDAGPWTDAIVRTLAQVDPGGKLHAAVRDYAVGSYEAVAAPVQESITKRLGNWHEAYVAREEGAKAASVDSLKRAMEDANPPL